MSFSSIENRQTALSGDNAQSGGGREINREDTQGALHRELVPGERRSERPRQ